MTREESIPLLLLPNQIVTNSVALNNRNISHHSPGGQKSAIKVQQGWVLREALRDSVQAFSPASGDCQRALAFLGP